MWIVAVVAMLTLSANAWAAGFDCRKAVTYVEKSICSDPKLSKLDDDLTESYKSALASAGDVAAAKAEQRAWLRDVLRACQSIGCIETAYTQRIGDLRGGKRPNSHWNPSAKYWSRAIMESADVKKNIIRIAGIKKYEELLFNFGVAPDTETVANFYIVGSGCAMHACTVSEGFFILDARSGDIFSAIGTRDGIEVVSGRGMRFPASATELYKEWVAKFVEP